MGNRFNGGEWGMVDATNVHSLSRGGTGTCRDMWELVRGLGPE